MSAGDRPLTTYEYYPLPGNSCECHFTTRVLDLLPARFPGDRIHGRLRTVGFEMLSQISTRVVRARQWHDQTATSDISRSSTREEEHFVALSYAWGEILADGAHLTEYIVCDGAAFAVTGHLYSALKRLRGLFYISDECEQPDATAWANCDGWWTNFKLHKLRSSRRPKSIWIDALCINQTDLEERSVQVQHMQRIYSASACLLIWLGELDEQDSFGEAQLMRAITGGPHFDTGGIYSRVKKDVSGHKSAMLHLTKRPWFCRRWVIQEVALGPSFFSYVMLGQFVCRKEALISAQSALLRKTTLPFNVPTASPRKDLLEMLQLCDKSKCSVPHDYVFAIAGISRPLSWLKYNYKENVSDLFASLASHYASRDRCGWILVAALATCRKHPAGQRPAGLASWMPDWSVEATYDNADHEIAVRRAGTARMLHIRCQSLGMHGLGLEGRMFVSTMGPVELYEAFRQKCETPSLRLHSNGDVAIARCTSQQFWEGNHLCSDIPSRKVIVTYLEKAIVDPDIRPQPEHCWLWMQSCDIVFKLRMPAATSNGIHEFVSCAPAPRIPDRYHGHILSFPLTKIVIG